MSFKSSIIAIATILTFGHLAVAAIYSSEKVEADSRDVVGFLADHLYESCELVELPDGRVQLTSHSKGTWFGRRIDNNFTEEPGSTVTFDPKGFVHYHQYYNEVLHKGPRASWTRLFETWDVFGTWEPTTRIELVSEKNNPHRAGWVFVSHDPTPSPRDEIRVTCYPSK